MKEKEREIINSKEVYISICKCPDMNNQKKTTQERQLLAPISMCPLLTLTVVGTYLLLMIIS